jgi:Flp pilus assembly protein TadD
MIPFLPLFRRIVAGACFLAAVSCGTAKPASASGGDDQARTRLRTAYSKSIEAEWAEASSNWTQAATLHGETTALLGALKRDYPGWQTDLLDRRLAESQNRGENARLHAQAGTTPPPPIDPVQREKRLERLLDELTRVRAILAEDSSPVPVDLSPADRPDSDLMRTNRLLQAEVAHLQKRIRVLEKQKPGRKPSADAAAVATSNSVCAALIRESARNQIKAGQVDPAIELLSEASPLFPDDGEITRLLATAYCRASRFRDAIRLLTEIPDPPPETLVILGSAYLATGQLGPARRTLEACLKAQPDMAAAAYNMAQLLLALSPPDVAGARAYYQSSLESGGARDPALENILGQATLLQNIKNYKRK